MNCIICNQEIENDSQFINGNWYHNECIENLQQENERLNNKIKEQNLLLIEFQDMEQKLDIYKSRCENALKKLKEIRQSTFTKYNSNEWDNCLSYNDDIKPLKNILNGSDGNE